MTNYSAPLAYRAASLETAACLWEAVLDMEAVSGTRSTDADAIERGALIRAAREANGSASLRLAVIGWTDAVDAAWKLADTDNGRAPAGGEYDRAFDWEFVPDWIVQNVDWTGPNAPTLRPGAVVAHDLDITAERLDVRGYGVAGIGAGGQAMFRAFAQPGGGRIATVIATNRAGTDLPGAADWRLEIVRGPFAGGRAVAALESISGADLDRAADFAESIARNLVFGERA